MGSNESIGVNVYNVLRDVITVVCVTTPTRVIITQHGDRKMKYHVKVYVDSAKDAGEMQPTLRIETILGGLHTQQV